MLDVILNIASSICGLIGTIMVFLYGVPAKIDTEGSIGRVCEQEDENEKMEIAKYKKLGNTGLIFLIGSFFFALVASIVSGKILH